MSNQTPPQYPSDPTGGEQPAQPQPPAYGSAPPPAYGTPPPQAYGVAPTGPTAQYASWWSRVGAILLDGLIAFAVGIVPIIIGFVILASTASSTTDEFGTPTSVDAGNPLGIVLIILGYALIFAFQIWNSAVRQGNTGQSLGKKILGIQVVRADSGQFLGAGTGVLRWLMAAILGGICLLDYLWPLWDDKKQTWHDKVVGSVVIRK